MAQRRSRGRTTVAIVGAGLSGICMAIDLIRQNKNRDFVILERGVSVGGTWSDNAYPGCCCDVWSHLYSFSFAPNPRWSREYPEQAEILEYIIGVAEKWGLFKHIRFNSEVKEARWDDEKKAWDIDVKVMGGKEAEFGEEYTLQAPILVSGVGQLNKPYFPKISGLEEFEGKVMHSARWDWSYALESKRIGIIGNGATAVQIVPEVAKTCKSLVVFQRTPNWIVPREDAPFSSFWQWAYTYLPLVRRRYRAQLMDMREAFYAAAQLEGTPEKEGIRKDCLKMMETQLPKDEAMRKKLVPEYPPGCKRVLVSDDYYPALNKPNVALEISSIEQATKTGIKTADGSTHEVDAIILATGFRTQDFVYPIRVYGKNGRELSDVWQGRPHAFMGMTATDMPNFFMLYGPNTNLGHNSIILMIEAQSRYINAVVHPILHSSMPLSIAPKTAVVDKWNAEIQARLQRGTVGSRQCSSWYKTDDGTVINNWCGTVVEYQNILSKVNWAEYDVDRKASGESNEDIGVPVTGTTYLGRIQEETSWAMKSMEIGVLGLAAVGIWRASRLML